jgi:hypothetical protein
MIAPMRRYLRLAWLAGAITLAAPTALLADWVIDGPAEAHAALSVAYTLDELVEVTPRVMVAKAVERRSVWEKIGGAKRIVTYTRLTRSESVYGDAPSELWVRTLGGAVGKIGQHVAGEARFRLGHESLVFLTQTDGGTYVVAGAAQGHYPIVADADDSSVRKLALSPNRGEIIKKKNQKTTIQEALGGVAVGSGVSKIKRAMARVNAKKK